MEATVSYLWMLQKYINLKHKTQNWMIFLKEQKEYCECVS